MSQILLSAAVVISALRVKYTQITRVFISLMKYILN